MLRVTIIHLGEVSLLPSSNLPENQCEPHCVKLKLNLFSYLVLHRMGFTMPHTVTSCAVSSYLTLSPLPVRQAPSAVYSLLHFPSAHTAQSLTGILLYGARTFLRMLGIPRSSNSLGAHLNLNYGNCLVHFIFTGLCPLINRFFSHLIMRRYYLSNRFNTDLLLKHGLHQ
ncbi:hypothetical protein SAMN03092900_1680 [Thiomicrospira sp. ALE5]|nr:hypothetical protein SAMN03092900_1680 [Thiomicrospira sp. ALE5]